MDLPPEDQPPLPQTLGDKLARLQAWVDKVASDVETYGEDYPSFGEPPTQRTAATATPSVMDFTGERPQEIRDARVPLPPAEQTRRSMLIGLALAFVGLVLLQLGFGLFLSDDTWNRVGPQLSTAATLVAAGFGYAWGHYFSGKN